jgi:hypothetical protein
MNRQEAEDNLPLSVIIDRKETVVAVGQSNRKNLGYAVLSNALLRTGPGCFSQQPLKGLEDGV